MGADALLVDPAHDADALVVQIGQHARAAGLTLRHLADLDATREALGEARRRGREPAVVIIGPHVERPLATARAVRSGWADSLLFAPAQARVHALRRELALAPMIGENWSLCEAESARFARVLEESAHSTRQRRTLRTTLDRANLRLSAREGLDAARYRAFYLSDRYLAAILRQAPDPILALDDEGMITACNRAAEELFGSDAAQAVGRPAAALPGWPRRLREVLEEARASGGAATLELGLGDPERRFRCTVSPVRDDGDRYIGAAVLLHDVTAASRALAAEQAARSQAEQISRMKDEFLATLSHELRTPLSAVLSWSQILQMKLGDTEHREGIEAIQRNARMQAQLIEDLLDVSRIVAGQPFLDWAPVSLVEVAERAVGALSPAAAGKRIAIERSYEKDVPAVRGDAKRLQQVMWNLLANAVKFTPEGGRVAIAVRCCAAGGVEASVEDSGAGIEAAFLPHLFERFRQADSTIRRAHGGLGLGLAIVKQLVDLHGGLVSAYSDGPGRGARFVVRLPAAPVEAWELASAHAADASEPPLERDALQGLRVLVVEDQPDSRTAAERILREWGAATASAGSVSEALELVPAFQPQVLVSDIGMPERDGYDLVRTLRRKGWSAEALPAVALTAYARAEDERLARASGFQAHIAKPLDAHRLVRAVVEVSRPAAARR